MKREFQKAAALALLLLLACAACDNTEHKIGSTVKGERIAIIDRSHKIEVDSNLKGSKPRMPPVTVVKDWPEAGFDASHLLPNAAIEAHPKEVWHSNIGEGSTSDYKLLAKPVIGGGLLFTMDAEGLVSAFDAAKGERKWKYDTTPKDADNNAMSGGLGYDAGTLYVTSGFGEVLAMNAGDGKIKWQRKLLNPIRSAPTIAHGHVYVVTIDNELQALDAATGEVKWHHHGIVESATLMGASNPAVSDNGVMVAYSSGEIFNLRPENGRTAWSYTLTVPTQVGALPAIADIRGLPVVDETRVFAISHSGRIAAIDQRTGDRAWEADIGGINTPIVAGNAVYVLSNDMQLVALDRDSGRVIWVQELPNHEDPSDKNSDAVFWTGPIMAADRLWLVNSLGKLTAYSADDGKMLYDIELPGPAYIAPVVAGNTMYVVLDSGRVIALR